ncbi:universal stress protein [Microlunatus elymi]|uniref:Universal stress protein n=1 Tax=Microlunatus elymi TaxID=2596828 RepID=A0A516PZW6_9ACTN|nr:universal stress protein [Microlunatus elymi]QDP96511.1 universal stress protein [Microlunatus elymi]
MTGTDQSADSTGTESTVVVGYSAKPEGRAALARGIAMARLSGAKIVIVHTAPDDDAPDVRAQLDASGLAYDIHQAPDVLDPAEELIKVSEASADAMIVIGLRRRSPVGKLLLGSNAQRILLDASCPVLAVKAE